MKAKYSEFISGIRPVNNHKGTPHKPAPARPIKFPPKVLYDNSVDDTYSVNPEEVKELMKKIK